MISICIIEKFANPSPMGLAAFAGTTFLLSLFNVQARGITSPNLIVGMAMAYGGLIQLLAGMWEFAVGNTFGATAFSSYGGFWISFGCIFIPGTGIMEAYTTASKAGQLDNALALYLFTWFIFTSIMLLATFRSSIGLVVLFFFLDCTFLLLAVGSTMPHVESITKAGGAFGNIAWYIAASALLSSEGSSIKLPNPSLR
ncbi:GPR1/FUN34/yaaH family-domain-containing protein [Phakopsora pachyrhizi]|uniref:GPR1/FUN34/yaaH family-domain-containing protein n=1 Tax=Phakopsora pachyrhizi TaxID=170000 RepID=A0AAV0AST3_PHAPC|nr:GPR1/FUN34/yaaH family-domain-containing protein [Phakopsora pachyrhizi]